MSAIWWATPDLNRERPAPEAGVFTISPVALGWGSRIRTDDIPLPKRKLYQTELFPSKVYGRGCCRLGNRLAAVVGFEPTTFALTGHRSTVELHRTVATPK